ncbi:hypothetical protein QFC21_004599 [Naganishia friedmannii]|uniref:Uncharacterized protein n=1 Tax=Naganishia friedmannii TaxID=89922 RepID=A0ACC2VGN8_9TREE|nr:hypothetical protein QFC21_004599 [Naganishia friedmannii]
MVRSYQRHGPTKAFGIITSPAPTASLSSNGRIARVPAWEDVASWDVRTGEQVGMWHSQGVEAEVTVLSPAPVTAEGTEVFAVAYKDGSIRLWSPLQGNPDGTEIVTLNGHKNAITSLTWDTLGTRLFSAAGDGEIVVWDTVEEVGLFRLKGHRGAVTAIHYLPHPSTDGAGGHPGFLVTTAKDTFLKLWDLGTQHCVQTIIVGRGEVTSFAVRDGIEASAEATAEQGEEGEGASGAWTIVTGSGDGEVKCWSISKRALAKGLEEDETGNVSRAFCSCTAPDTRQMVIAVTGNLIFLFPSAQLKSLVTSLPPLPTTILPRSSSTTNASTNPITHLTFHPDPRVPLLYLQTSDRSVVVLRWRSTEELEAKRARRRKREKEKRAVKGADTAVNAEDDKEGEEEDGDNGWVARLTEWCVVRAGGKIRGVSLPQGEEGESQQQQGLQILFSLSNNSLETYTIPTPPLATSSSAGTAGKSARQLKASSATGRIEPTRTHVLELPGHRNDVRALAVSADDRVLASASNGDRHVVIGTKTGHLEVYDLASATLLESIQAHQGALWSLDLRADKGGLVTGSADKDVKFWDIRMKEVEGSGPGSRIVTRLGEERVIKTKQIGLVHTKTLKMTDDVLNVKYSPDGRLLAVALLDSTVKVFFQDTLKFFLSLYGHKLPVLSMDISSDSKLIVTCSADKNVKIWGLDFGDCHKSIFAHEESIMQIAFERNSHYFWTVGKDRLVKYWDGDKFELIQKFSGHHGEVWALAVSNFGEFVVSGSHDKSIRVWEKTDEPLFLEEERERELEQMYESNAAESLNKDQGKIGSGVDGADIDGDADEVSAVAKQSAETLMAGEKIMEAIEIADTDRGLTRDYEDSRNKLTGQLREALMPPTRNPTLIAMGGPTPEDYVRGVMEKVPPAQMEDALLVLPFKQVISLLEYLALWAANETNISLVSRVLFFLLRTHHHQIVSNRIMRKTLQEVRLHLRNALTKQKETLGYNMAALKYIKRLHDANKTASLFEEELLDEEKVRARIEEGMKKRKRVAVK